MIEATTKKLQAVKDEGLQKKMLERIHSNLDTKVALHKYYHSVVYTQFWEFISRG